MKSNIVSVTVLVLFALVSVVDLLPVSVKNNNSDKIEFNHERNEGYIAFIANEQVKNGPDDVLGPDPDPAKCICKGTGIITHGDGHQTPCPYHGQDNPASGERDWGCKCDSEKGGTYCGCKEEHGRCDCDKQGVKKRSAQNARIKKGLRCPD